jgi:hypothetical protein
MKLRMEWYLYPIDWWLSASEWIAANSQKALLLWVASVVLTALVF